MAASRNVAAAWAHTTPTDSSFEWFLHIASRTLDIDLNGPEHSAEVQLLTMLVVRLDSADPRTSTENTP